MSMAGNDHDVTLDLMENIACHTVDKQVQDRAPAFCAGNLPNQYRYRRHIQPVAALDRPPA